MRKYKNNIRQQVFRGHHTPSPTNFADLKSPRLGTGVNKKADINQQASKQYTPSQQFSLFKIQLKLAKQRQNGTYNDNQQNKNKRSNKGQNEPNINKNFSQNDLNPYNYYFKGQKSQAEDRKHSVNDVIRTSPRKTSISRQQLSQGHSFRNNNYQETIRKLANQNIRLKNQFKILLQKNQKNSIEKKNIIEENKMLKSQFQRILKLNQQMQRKENMMTEQIKNLKKMLTLSSEELSNSNYEIFKTKQDLIQLKLINEKLQTKNKQKTEKKKHLSFKAQKILSPQTQSETINRWIPCKNCKILNSSIADLIFQNQNLKLQIGQKNTLITTLCSEIQKVEGQLKFLEKPKNLQKKYNNIINQLNQQIVNQKAKDLSYKYMKITK